MESRNEKMVGPWPQGLKNAGRTGPLLLLSQPSLTATFYTSYITKDAPARNNSD
jgi:hypothetical protein